MSQSDSNKITISFDEINSLQVNENNSLSKTHAEVQLVCDLHVQGNKVCLPRTAPVDFKSQEYEKEFLHPIPDDIASEVSSVIKSKRSHFTILKLLTAFLFLSFLSWAIFLFFPKPRMTNTFDEISREGLYLAVKYNNLVAKAQEESQKKQWQLVIDLLENDAREISKNKSKVLENGELLGLYFDAIGHSPKHIKTDVPKEIIDNVRKHSPNCLGWYLDWLRIYYPESRRFGALDVDEKRAEEMKKLFESDNPVRDWKDNAFDYDKNKDLLYLYWARLEFYYWCYSGKRLKQEDQGVSEREDAYRICEQYNKPGSTLFNESFLQLQLEILDTLDHAWGVFSRAYFHGEETFSKKALRTQRDSLLKPEESK